MNKRKKQEMEPSLKKRPTQEAIKRRTPTKAILKEPPISEPPEEYLVSTTEKKETSQKRREGRRRTAGKHTRLRTFVVNRTYALSSARFAQLFILFVRGRSKRSAETDEACKKQTQEQAVWSFHLKGEQQRRTKMGLWNQTKCTKRKRTE
jgi:hypothetical protein